MRAVVNLTCAEKNQMIDRLQRRALRENRLDDANLEVIKKRLETHERDTRPVLDYYGPKLVHNVDSSQSPLHVLRDILDMVVKIA